MTPGWVVWITGVPASGKSTLAEGLIQRFQAAGTPVLWLDSDELRKAINPNASYSDEDRNRFYSTLTYLAETASKGGVCTIISATATRRAYRDTTRDRVDKFVEVWLSCDPDEVRRRDPKGLYAQAASGEIKSLPGAGADYEAPAAAEITFDTTRSGADDALAHVWAELQKLGMA